MLDPLQQFLVQPILPLSVLGLDLSFTNASLFMLLTTGIILIFFHEGVKQPKLCPARLQMAAELLFSFVNQTFEGNAGQENFKYFPLVFSVFLFVLFGNLLGMVPGAFTFTSHIIVTFAMALFIFTLITILGLLQQGFSFFQRFLPEGLPWIMIPLIIPVEILSYFFRPISLSVRLFANMLAGHIVLKIFSGFTVMLGLFGVFPLGLNIIFVGFEFFVAILQAYIFTILSCVYLKDALNTH